MRNQNSTPNVRNLNTGYKPKQTKITPKSFVRVLTILTLFLGATSIVSAAIIAGGNAAKAAIDNHFNPKVELVYVADEFVEEYLGEFKVTGYTDNKNCTGRDHALTATQTKPHPERTVGCAPQYKNKFVYIEGIGVRACEDTGSAVTDKVVDLFFTTEDQAKKWGAQRKNVWLLKS